MDQHRQSAEKTICWGFLCTASITRKMKKAVDESSTGRVCAVASRTVAQAEDWVKEHMEKGEEIAAYGTYDALFNDKKIQLVYIPLPSGIKKEWALKAAHNKKHVLCEKPFASAGEVADIISACKQNNVCFWDNTMFIHHPRTKEMMDLMKSGELGEIRHVHAGFSYILPKEEDDNIRVHKEVEPHGALGDIGWYPIRAVLLSMNLELPTRVFATATYRNNVIDSCRALLYFKDPLKGATIHCGFTTATNQCFTVNGTHKTLICEDPFFPFHDDPFEYPKVEQTGVTCYKLRDNDGRFETRKVCSPKRQEVILVEKFNELLTRKCNGNLKPELEMKYANFALYSQKILDAIEESCRRGGALVDIK